MLSATASLGLSLLWDTDLGLSHVDKYTYSSEEYIKVSVLVCVYVNNINALKGRRIVSNRHSKLWSEN